MNQTEHISSSQYRTSVRKRAKYGNTRTDGFASKWERDRYEQLHLMELGGEISELRCQVEIPLIGQHDMPILYDSARQASLRVDFAYIVKGDRRVTYEDAKGFELPTSKLKRAIVQAMTGHPVLISKAPTKRGRRG